MRYLIVLLLFFYGKADAQVTTFYNHISNEVHVIHSKALQEDRRLYIHVPKTDTASQTLFPVLYLLDGENHFHTVAAYIDYLSHWKIIPPTMVVSIINADRVRDLTPVKSLTDFDGQLDSGFMKSGGNEQFFNFIEKELIPHIDSGYKTSPYKIFAGHSFGGLTVINNMLRRPGLFDAYIAVSPSFWFGKKIVLSQAALGLPALEMNNRKLFYSVGNEDEPFRSDVLLFDSIIIKKNKAKSFEHLFKYYPDEDHMSEPIPAYYDALRFIFKNWQADTKH